MMSHSKREKTVLDMCASRSDSREGITAVVSSQPPGLGPQRCTLRVYGIEKLETIEKRRDHRQRDTHPQIMHPRLRRIAVQPPRIWIAWEPVYNGKANGAALRDLESEIIMHSYHSSVPIHCILFLSFFSNSHATDLIPLFPILKRLFSIRASREKEN